MEQAKFGLERKYVISNTISVALITTKVLLLLNLLLFVS